MAVANTAEWTVKALGTGDAGRWDAFVKATPAGTFFHLSGWRDVIGAAFSHASHYLYAERDGVVGGVLPLFHMKSRLFGNALISTPFCSYGGPVAANEVAHDALVDAASELATDLDVDYLEMRNLASNGRGWPRKDLYATFRVPIEADPDANFKAIPGKRRNMVRRGMRAGLCRNLDDDIGRHYDIYARMVRNLGTPVFSKRYFELLKERFGDDCEILSVTVDGQPVSSMMSFYFREEMLVYYGGGTRAARNLGSNDFLYWQLIERACERGVRLIDFGRSKRGTGAYNFKVYWGWEPQPLHYEYQLINAEAVPNVSPANPKYRRLVNAWKRLPVPVTRVLGPILSRNLG